RALELGGGHFAMHRLLRDLGLSTLGHPADYYGPGLTLGNGETRLLELANAYAAIARGGAYAPFRLLIGRTNDEKASQRMFSAESAYLLSDMLCDNRARAASFGLNSYLSFPYPVACKTGTSSDYRDNWAVGYTPEFTVAVWVGNPDGRPMQRITGVTGAAPAMHRIMDHLRQTHGTTWFAKPAGIRDGWINPLTGHKVAAEKSGSVREIFSHAPLPEKNADYDAQGRVVLGDEYRDWLASRQNGLGNLANLGADNNEVRILSPAPGTVYYLDPDLPRESQRISLQTSAPTEAEWSSETLAVESADGRSSALLDEGRHEITVRAGDQAASTWVTVHSL
ncbi:MAG: penicillin-binding transpeptidase domain-containing protein, partial [Chthoniobacterales bacterium]